MQIYGREFSDVFREIPWPYKIVVVLGSLFIVFIIIHLIYISVAAKPVRSKVGPLSVSGQQNNTSILDPSLAAATGNKAFLAYAGIEQINSEAPGGVSVSIASGGEQCRHWQYIGKAFEAKNEELLAPDGQDVLTGGVWRYETPSLVYDAADTGNEWKLFAYKYFWAGNVALAKQYGVVVYKSSSDPSANKWSEERWLFSAAPGYPPPPYQQMVGNHLNGLSPQLAGYASYSRPSVITAGKFLLMMLSAYKEGAVPDAIVLLGSSDHGKSWTYMGTPLQTADAAKVGAYTHLDGATLLVEKGKIYLAAVFGGKDRGGEGTHLLRFSDLTSGVIARDDKGAPVSHKHIPLMSAKPTVTGGGYAGYSDVCEHGILTSEQSGVTGKFQIFKTYQTPSSELQ